jgi:hypothetical protein
MQTALNPTLRHIGKELQKVGETTVRQPLPWRFLDLLCQLDEKEDALRASGRRDTESAATTRPRPQTGA